MNITVARRTLRILGLCGVLFAMQTSVEASITDAKRPNVLLVIADDWSFGHAGAYGCKWINTPAFDRVAREGVLFSNAFTNNPKCSPCRASLLTDSSVIRSDMLDYGLEVEWFDANLGKILDQLERIGELEDTIVLVTSDHGMPFPRVKGQIYEAGFHLPMAARWGRRVKPGRVVDDFINVRDLAPTFLEVAGLKVPASMSGRSFLGSLVSEKSGQIDPTRNRMVIGKERHDLGRPHDQGYPVRAIRTPQYLYVRNYEPDRWPAGNPETSYPKATGR